MSGSGRLVYSTENGRVCPDCKNPLASCRCQQLRRSEQHKPGDGFVRLRRETKGRKGKGVTLVDGLPLSADELAALAKTLKNRCGSGGTVKDGMIEIQGDHRATLQSFLQDAGYKVKLAGG